MKEELKILNTWLKKNSLKGVTAETKRLVIKGSKIKEIPSEISALTKLASLSIVGCDIKSVPKSLCTLINLKELKITKCNLAALPDGICALTGLQSLDLSDNQIVDISTDLENLKKLLDLNLQNNRIVTISLNLKEMYENGRLMQLNLTGNYIYSFEDQEDIFDKLGVNTEGIVPRCKLAEIL